MKRFIAPLVLLASAIALPAQAVEWTQLTENSVGDKFFIDTSSIRTKGDQVSFWHYRQFIEPNNAFLDEQVEAPVHGTVIRLSANCKTKTARIYRLNAYDKARKLIQRFDYGATGQPMTIKSGSSAFNILDYACSYKPEKSVETKADPKATEEGDNATEGKGEVKPTTPKR
jgi:hypothetical protein